MNLAEDVISSVAKARQAWEECEEKDNNHFFYLVEKPLSEIEL